MRQKKRRAGRSQREPYAHIEIILTRGEYQRWLRYWRQRASGTRRYGDALDKYVSHIQKKAGALDAKHDTPVVIMSPGGRPLWSTT